MVDIILTAIPFFIAFIVIEVVSLWFAPDDAEVGYEVRDTATSLAMGLGSVGIGIFYKALQLVVYAALYAVTPLRLDTSLWWGWVLILLVEDLAYYWYHRAHHEVRILWASHVVHHSSQRYNFSTALRQTWTPFGGIPFWAAARPARRAGLGDLAPAVDLARLPVLPPHRARREALAPGRIRA